MAAMTLDKLLPQLTESQLTRGDLKKLAKEIKRDHGLALKLWKSTELNAVLLASLILDKKQLTQRLIEELVAQLSQFEPDAQYLIVEWLMANQLTKSKATRELILTWRTHSNSLLQRLFWYYQARLRWTGQPSPNDTGELLGYIESELADAHQDVQWTMNFCAAWIGIYDEAFRQRCIDLGIRIGLYKDEKVAKNCTPSYLPEFIRIEVAKRR